VRSRRLYEIRSRVLEALRRLARELSAEVYLFGSYARGDHMVESDVDIVVVSPLFRGLKYLDRVALVRSRLPGDVGFDIIALTPEEFRERLRRSPLLQSISRYWVRIT
jgi:predicted nucleotidyltransferase